MLGAVNRCVVCPRPYNLVSSQLHLSLESLKISSGLSVVWGVVQISN